MAAEARSVVVRLSMDTAQAIRSSQQFGSEMDRAMTQAEKSIQKPSAAMDELATKAGKAGATAAVGLGLVGKAAVDWESAWAGVEKTVDGTAGQMAELEGELRDLATTLPATHAEIAGVAEAAGQLGVAREDVAEFTKTMIDLGETTNLTAEGAATNIAQISNVMGTAAEDVDNFGSALVALGNDGASTEAQILGMAQRIAGAGAQIGLVESDILAIANAAASMGIEVEAGGSAISRVFTEMAKATKQGGDDLDAFAEVAGVSAADFVQSFETDPARAFASFTEGLARINAAGGAVFTTLDDLGLADVRVSQALLSMSAAGDLLTDSLDLGAEAWEENTALAEEAGKRYDTTAAEVQVAWNKVKDAGIEAGAALLPVISSISEVVGTAADMFAALPEPVQQFLVGGTAMVAMLGLGVAGFVKLTGAITSTRTQLAAVTAESKLAGRALGAVTAGSRLAAIGRGAAVLGGLAVATTGVADGMGLSNTASMALMGTIAGPWGAAIGGGVGLMMDFASANDDAAAAIDRINGSLGGTSFSALLGDSAALEKGADSWTKTRRAVEGTVKAIPIVGAPGGFLVNKLFGEQGKDIDAATDKMFEAEKAAKDLAVALGAGTTTGDSPIEWLSDAGFRTVTVDVEEMAAALAAAEPAMESLGITIEDLLSMSDGERATAFGRIADEIDRLDSAEGRVEAVGEAFAGLEGDLTSTADAAKTLKSALDALLDPAISQEKATLAWKESLRNLKGELAENSRSLSRNTDEGQQNREAIIGMVEDLKAKVNADAAAGASSEELASRMRTGRKAILDAAEAAGLNRGAVREMIDQMNLTPEMIETIFETVGAEKAKGDAAAVKAALDRIDRSVTVNIDTYRRTFEMGGNRGSSPSPGSGRDAGIQRAGGGPVFGPGTETSDSIPVWMSNSEHVWSAREVAGAGGHAAVERMRAAARAGMLGFATGGNRGGGGDGGSGWPQNFPGVTVGPNIAAQVAALAASFGTLEQKLKASEKVLDRETAKRDTLASAHEALANSIESAYRTSFDGESSAFVTTSQSPVATLESDIARLNQLDQARAALSNKGVDEEALDALLREMSLPELQAMGTWSVKDLKQYAQLFEQRESLLASVGTRAADAAYGADLSVANAELKGLRQEVKGLRQDVRKAEKQAKKNSDKKAAAQRRGARQGRRNQR